MSRGMMKWAPYASLIEQKSHMEKMRYERGKVTKPQISQERAEVINQYLCHYVEGSELIFTYYEDGYIYQIKQSIRRIFIEEKRLLGSQKHLAFSQILNIQD